MEKAAWEGLNTRYSPSEMALIARGLIKPGTFAVDCDYVVSRGVAESALLSPTGAGAIQKQTPED